MSHQPVSVVVTAGGRAADLRYFLESLRPTLGVRDEVVCVVPPGHAALRSHLHGQRWLRLLDATADDQPGRWAAGVAATTHPVVVLLDGDTVVAPAWLDAVAGAFADPTVVAAGPRVHRGAGPQGAEVPNEALTGPAAFKAYARQWRQDHRDDLTDVDRLGPVCVAVRREALERAGGPTLDLPYERLRELGRLVVVGSALVTHLGLAECGLRTPRPSDAPLLSASMIVKDEEAVLAGCLRSLDGLVDEVVVYDTGSTDRTREIAREHGAAVIEGYWDDHFGDARNRSLARCRGRWILWIDADEVVTGDVAALRRRLAAAERSDGHTLRITNTDDSVATEFLAPRLFRGGDSRYEGRLHEKPVDRVTGRHLSGTPVDEIALVHSGYSAAAVALKGKRDRNRRLAALATAESGFDAAPLRDHARSEMFAGNLETVVDLCRTGLERHRGVPDRVEFLSLLVEGCARLGRLAEANAALDELRGLARSPVTVAKAESLLRFAEGDHLRVLEVIERVPDEGALDDGLAVVNRQQLSGLEIASLTHTGRAAEAADRLRDRLRDGDLPLSLAGTATVLAGAGSDIGEVADLVPATGLRQLLHRATNAPAPLADALCDALWQRYPSDVAVLGFVSWLGERLPLTRALEWSARLRQHGLADRCALLAVAGAGHRSAPDRVLAAAIAYETFADEAAMPLLAAALEQVGDDEADAVLAQLRTLAPGIAAAIEPVPAG